MPRALILRPERRGKSTKPLAVSERLMISRAAVSFERGFEFVACIATIGKDMAQKREAETDGFEDIDSAVAILNVSGKAPDKH